MTIKEKLLLLGKFCLTVFFLFLSWDVILCGPIESPAQTFAKTAMAIAADVTFFVYWVLWILWDEKTWAQNFKFHRMLLFCAVGLSLTRLVYSVTLCPTDQEITERLERLGVNAPATTLTDPVDSSDY